MNQILIYQNSDNQTNIEVKFVKDSVWLDAHQIAELFGVKRPAIVKHIGNIYHSGELEELATCSKMEQVAADGKKRLMNLYNLDVIISTGYRVNSVRATQFRQWATQRLKEYLVQGYAINQKRLDELQQTVQLIQKTISTSTELEEAKGLLEIITQYTQSFVLLSQFDSNSLPQHGLSEEFTYEIDYNEAKLAVAELKQKLILRNEATELFGNEKDRSFEGILGNIIQSFDGQYLYPTIEEQAAHLLYFVIKNHPFSDGNKRIGAFLFIWFLEKNKHRFKQSGELKINDNALVAIALLVAQSNPSDKEMMIQLIIQLIRKQ